MLDIWWNVTIFFSPHSLLFKAAVCACCKPKIRSKVCEQHFYIWNPGQNVISTSPLLLYPAFCLPFSSQSPSKAHPRFWCSSGEQEAELLQMCIPPTMTLICVVFSIQGLHTQRLTHQDMQWTEFSLERFPSVGELHKSDRNSFYFRELLNDPLLGGGQQFCQRQPLSSLLWLSRKQASLSCTSRMCWRLAMS